MSYVLLTLGGFALLALFLRILIPPPKGIHMESVTRQWIATHIREDK